MDGRRRHVGTQGTVVGRYLLGRVVGKGVSSEVRRYMESLVQTFEGYESGCLAEILLLLPFVYTGESPRLATITAVLRKGSMELSCTVTQAKV